MLLQDYLLLNLGRTTLEAANAWRTDMVARRQVDATRDLLAFWRPQDGERLITYPVMGLKRFRRAFTAAEVGDGLARAVEAALEGFGLQVDRTGNVLNAGGRPVCSVAAEQHGEVGAGSADLDLAGASQALGRDLDHRAVANAIAYHFEQVFGYAQASKHPVAYEESLRPKE